MKSWRAHPAPPARKPQPSAKPASANVTRLAAWGDAPLAEVTGAALLDALGTYLTGKYPERSSHLLAELFRRLGVIVTVTPEP